MKIQKLIQLARKARRPELSQYSRFAVGAALLAQSGQVYSGCNVESSSFGLTLCAERVALLKALSEGEKQFESLAIVAPGPKATPPCGACRQLLYEYAPDLTLYLASLNGTFERIELKELLPKAFDKGFLTNE